MKAQKTQNILVVGPAWIGDMVMAQSLFKLIKQRQPHGLIDVLAPPWTEPLLARMPEVNEALLLPLDHGQLGLRMRWQLGKALRPRRYDRAIVLPRTFKSALVPFAAQAVQRTGFLGEARFGLLNDIRSLDPRVLARTVDRYVALGLDREEEPPATFPYPRLAISRDNAQAALARLGQNMPRSPVLGLCPGAAYGPAKRWPAPYFAEVANVMLNQGWEVWLFGSHKDAPITADIQAMTRGACLDLGGRTALGECIDLMSLANAVVTNDTGLMHLAAGLDRALVAIFGSSDPGYTPPLHPHATILYLSLPCSPCFERTCPLGHYNCLRDIKPQHVLAALGNVTS
ncbi:MAG: lipopolysaccharide heptosyltransferase II [Gammaproteobacteria bacterium]|nr:lipopolysaccharide heptosyltransferase II [Gammaproteobacteria bacterium]MCI0590238.1 lipopolysaccharide heptosyltransferase II [Gammaproteobacteria bacterium]